MSKKKTADTAEQAPLSRRQKRRRKRYEKNIGPDIRYRGPLSYRSLKILAWVCLALSQVLVLMNLNIKIDPSCESLYGSWPRILSLLFRLALPFFLVGNFALILDKRESYARQLLRYGLLSAAVLVVCLLVYNRYILGVTALFMGGREAARTAIGKAFSFVSGGRGFLSFNIFIDLFLCTLFMFLLNYRPKKILKGKWTIVLRVLSILPVAYETASIVLKILSSLGEITLPLWVFPLLTTKPPMTFFAFIAMALFIKFRERVFIKMGGTHEQYGDFLKTRRNSLHFSVFIAVTFVIAAILDVIGMIFLASAISVLMGIPESDYVDLFTKVQSWGIGDSVILVAAAPVMLLFSYTRTHKNNLIDLALPIVGIVFIVVIYVEGIYQSLTMLAASAANSVIESIMP
ncbi:MAG: hypothetical protein IJL78_02920 [Lachnospiraceae bacterium]|nr:hypothetical protein [Lachnospiraceae bacterium]